MEFSRLQEALKGRYEVGRELGRGGMASVYLAQDLRHGRQVALKVVRPELLDLVGRERFLREIRVTAGLAHPHIRPLLDSGEVDDALYYVMPLAEGATLADRLEQEPHLPVAEAARLGSEIADALAYAHDHGVVHRDVKPSNILLESGHAILSDFGVAIPTGARRGDRLTSSRVTLGTPEYMSPEQCSGEIEVGPRSDVYSLGCVLYQMLSGQPPFTARTPAAVVAQQLRDPPPPLRTLRSDVPAPLEDAVHQALSKDPERRFPDAAAMRDALLHHLEERPHPKHSMRLVGFGLGVVVLLAAAVGIWSARTPRQQLDEARYAVLAFQHRDVVGDSSPVDGARCEIRLREALLRWEGVKLVDAQVMHDRELRHQGRSVTLAQALSDARSVGAGRLIWGQVWEEADTARVEGALYDVASGTVLRRHRVSLVPAAPVGPYFDEMADSLLVGQVAEATARAGVGGTRSLDALRMYDEGHRYLRTWDLADAADAFAAAADRDPGYAHASLWRSLVGLFRGEAYGSWEIYAAQAAREAEDLSARERLLARGLRELTATRWQEACDAFGQAVARDSLSFDAWLGLGDCRARDSRVVRDTASASGWSFRGSWEDALRAYQRALALAPSYNYVLQGNSVSQLERVIPSRVGNMRMGWTADSASFAAHPELRADTFAFVPWPTEELLARPIGGATFEAAERGREIAIDLMRPWVVAFPDDPLALQAFARALEGRGRITPTGDPRTSALDAVVRARQRTSPDSAEANVALAVDQIRILVKMGRFADAVALGDSVLDLPASRDPAVSERAAGIALLLGRAHLAAGLLEAAAPVLEFWHPSRPVTVPVPLRETAARLAAYASAGGPPDTLDALRGRAEAEAEAQVPAADREPVLSAAVGEAIAMAYPALRYRDDDPPPVAAGNPLPEAFRNLAAGRLDLVRAGLVRSDSLAASLAPGGKPPSVALSDAVLWIAVGDSAHAAGLIDQVLTSLRIQDLLLLSPREAGPLVRLMALRARLAGSLGDPATAQRWAQAVLTLWGGGDGATIPTVQSMTALLSERGS